MNNPFLLFFLSVIRTRFILTQTHHPGNVGASARAIKTMGFFDLALVSPHDPKVLTRNKTVQRASGATDVLNGTKIYASLDEALMDINEHGNEEIICGTGMPVDMYQERLERNYVEPRQFFEQLVNVDNDTATTQARGSDDESVRRIAFIFGNEKSGMEESDMDKCQYMLGIPTNPKFGSLNLASAVQLIAYDWRVALGYYDTE